MLLPLFSIAEAEVIYNKKERRLSVNVVSSPLTEILREVSKRTGVIIKMDSAINNPVTVKFNDLTLEEGLKEIIKPYSYAMTYRENVGEGKRDYSVKILQLFKNGTAGIATLDVGIDNTLINKPALSNTSLEQRIKADDLSVNNEKEIPIPLPQEISLKNDLLRGPLKRGKKQP
jgi:hypothetical protein